MWWYKYLEKIISHAKGWIVSLSFNHAAFYLIGF